MTPILWFLWSLRLAARKPQALACHPTLRLWLATGTLAAAQLPLKDEPHFRSGCLGPDSKPQKRSRYNKPELDAWEPYPEDPRPQTKE